MMHRMRQRIEHGVGGAGGEYRRGLEVAHAAFLSPPAKAVERIGKMAAHCGGLLGGQHAIAVRLQQCLGNAGCLGRGVERPAEMLARVAPSDRNAVVGEHLVVQREQ